MSKHKKHEQRLQAGHGVAHLAGSETTKFGRKEDEAELEKVHIVPLEYVPRRF
jgi:hypothetical protein